MFARSTSISLLLCPILACTKKEEPKPSPAAPAAAPDEETLVVATDDAIEGPVPPDTSAVLFVVEGALIPVACFDKEKKLLRGGDACKGLVKEGDEVRLSSGDTSSAKKLGAMVEPGCAAGEGRKNAYAIEGLVAGADYRFAAWPPSFIQNMKMVGAATTKVATTKLTEDEQTQLLAGIKRYTSGVSGELVAKQVVSADLDGNPQPEKFYSVYLPDPNVQEIYKWSGMFMAADGDLERLTLVDMSKTKRDVFEVRGSIDVDGDAKAELWVRKTFEGGGGDRIFRIKGNKFEPLGEWTCGAS